MMEDLRQAYTLRLFTLSPAYDAEDDYSGLSAKVRG